MSFQVLNGADASGEIVPVIVENQESSHQWKHLPFLRNWNNRCPLSFITRTFVIVELFLNVTSSLFHFNNDNICLSFDRIFYKGQGEYRSCFRFWL